MAQAFTCFEKFGAACEMLTEDDRRAMVYAIGAYGMLGEEPELPYPLNVIFSLIKDDIDNSKASRANAAKGGRPRGSGRRQEARAEETEADGAETKAASRPETCVREVEETGVSEIDETVVREAPKTGVFEIAKPGVSENEKPGFSQNGNPIQANTSQANTGQEKRRGGARGPARFRAPTPEEVDAFASEAGIAVDGAAFCDFYASKGWRVGSAPMRDWRAAARNWARRDAGGAGRPGARRGEVSAGDEYSRL